MEIIPDGGNLNLCLICGARASGCPATGLADMDDKEVTTHPWVSMCTMRQRCIYVCPMKIDIPQRVFNARAEWPSEEKPSGIMKSCGMALRNDSNSAMGTAPDDFIFVAEDVLAIPILARKARQFS